MHKTISSKRNRFEESWLYLVSKFNKQNLALLKQLYGYWANRMIWKCLTRVKNLHSNLSSIDRLIFSFCLNRNNDHRTICI